MMLCRFKGFLFNTLFESGRDACAMTIISYRMPNLFVGLLYVVGACKGIHRHIGLVLHQKGFWRLLFVL